MRGCTFFLRKKRRRAASAFLGVSMGGFYLFWARLCRAQRKEPRAAAARVHYTAMFLGCPPECVRARRDAATGTVSGGVPRARAMGQALGGGPRDRVRARTAASVGRVSRAWAHGAHGGSHLPRRVAGQRAEAGQAPASQPGQPASQPSSQPASQPANPPSIQPASQPNHWNSIAWGSVFSDEPSKTNDFSI